MGRAGLGGAVKSLGAFGLAPLMISIMSMVAVPVLFHQLGSRLWMSIAVGQAAGELCRAVTIWGWNSVGLTRVSLQSDAERTRYYLESLVPRCLLFGLTIIGLTVSAGLLPLASPQGYLLMGCAGSLMGLGGSWAFIGAREPKNLILMDALPRALGVGTGIISVSAWGGAQSFAVPVIVGNLCAVIAPLLLFLHRRSRDGITVYFLGIPRIRESLTSGFSAFLIGFVLTARMSLPVLLSPILVPQAAPVVVLADKFLRWGNTAMTPVMQYVQTGIPRMSGSHEQRARRGTKVVAILGVGLTFAAAAATLLGAPLMSAGKVDVSPMVSILTGVTLGLVFTSSVTGNSTLVMLGRTGTVAKGAIIGLIAMALLIMPLGTMLGAVGVILAYVLAELGIVIFQMTLLKRILREHSTSNSHRSSADQEGK